MMQTTRWSSFLGLANRARKVISGEELVVKEIKKGNARLVLLSSDASENTKKKIVDKCSFYHTPVKIVSDRYILGQAIGKHARVVIAVIDQGFAKKLDALLDE